jgi:AcrR family transcriptional regulator
MRAINSSGEQDRTFTENARRAQIVRAAIETIGELGYHATSFARIAERAGLSSTGMISYHFRGKDDLMDAVMTEVTGAASDYMEPRIQAAGDHRAMLHAYIESNIDFVRDHRAEITALQAIMRSGRTVGGAGEWFGATVDLIAEHFADGQRAGVFREFDPLVMAITLRQAIDGIHWLLATDPAADFAAYASELVTTFDRATERQRGI